MAMTKASTLSRWDIERLVTDVYAKFGEVIAKVDTDKNEKFSTRAFNRDDAARKLERIAEYDPISIIITKRLFAEASEYWLNAADEALNAEFSNKRDAWRFFENAADDAKKADNKANSFGIIEQELQAAKSVYCDELESKSLSFCSDSPPVLKEAKDRVFEIAKRLQFSPEDLKELGQEMFDRTSKAASECKNNAKNKKDANFFYLAISRYGVAAEIAEFQLKNQEEKEEKLFLKATAYVDLSDSFLASENPALTKNFEYQNPASLISAARYRFDAVTTMKSLKHITPVILTPAETDMKTYTKTLASETAALFERLGDIAMAEEKQVETLGHYETALRLLNEFGDEEGAKELSQKYLKYKFPSKRK